MMSLAPGMQDLLCELDSVAATRTAQGSTAASDVAEVRATCPIPDVPTATGIQQETHPKSEVQVARQARLIAESIGRKTEAAADEITYKTLNMVNAHLDSGEVDVHDAVELAKLAVRVKEARDRVRLAEGGLDNIPNITVMIGADFTHAITVEPVRPATLVLAEDVTPHPATEDASARVSPAVELEVERLLALHVTPINDAGSGDDE